MSDNQEAQPQAQEGQGRVEEIRARRAAIGEGRWWVEESERTWQLFACQDIEWPEGHVIPCGGHGYQLIKAPKKSEEYAEYWPDKPLSDFIVNAPLDVDYLLERIAQIEEENHQLQGRLGFVDEAHADLVTRAREILARAEAAEGELARVRPVVEAARVVADYYKHHYVDASYTIPPSHLAVVAQQIDKLEQAPTPHEGQEGRGDNSRPEPSKSVWQVGEE